jgi:GGDEF domain-containing protein
MFVFLDYYLEDGGTRFDVLKGLKDKQVFTAFVFLTRNIKRTTAFEVLQMSAMDYLTNAKVDEFELAKCISYPLYRKHREVGLQTMALRDTLAGLGNRVLFEENLRMSVELAKRPNENLGVLYIDLDGFKEINDTHGHAGGDAILK